MKSVWFKNRREYELAALVHGAGGSGAGFYASWADFLECAAVSLYQAARRAGGQGLDSEREGDYMRAIQRQQHPKKFCEAVALLVTILEADEYDALGGIYGAMELNDVSFRGQCFTPRHLCDVIAQMTLGDIKPDPQKRLTVSEPCVGGGAIALAADAHLRKQGFNPWHWFLWAQDISLPCFYMAYIQLTLCGVPAIVSLGNSLSSEPPSRSWPTMVAVLHPYRRPPEPAPPPRKLNARELNQIAYEKAQKRSAPAS